MKLHFLGAAGEVTGSCFLVEAAGRRLLIDCGLIQGSRQDEARNRDPFPFDVKHLDAVILTHAHLDHSGRIPLLVNAGYPGRIYAQYATRDLCRVLLKDAGHLNEKDAEWENRKRQRKGLPPVAPLYTLAEAQAAMRAFRALDYDTEVRLFPGIRFRFRDAGHILGSAHVELWCEEGGQSRKLVFSGDIGHYGAPILRQPTAIDRADLVIMESTYGDRCHRGWDETWAELGGILGAANAARGNVLIPAFAVGRTQELLYAFREHFEDWGLGNWQIFLDSPMAIEATRLYARYERLFNAEAMASQRRNGQGFSLPNLTLSHTANQSMAINRIRAGAIIIAGSGMCTGGRIKHHLKHNLWWRDSHLVFVGFQARGTLGRQLVDGARRVRLWGETIRVAARVHTVGGLSAHAGQDGLLRWYGNFSGRPRVAVVHGEPDASTALDEALRRMGAPSRIPRRGEVWTL